MKKAPHTSTATSPKSAFSAPLRAVLKDPEGASVFALMHAVDLLMGQGPRGGALDALYERVVAELERRGMEDLFESVVQRLAEATFDRNCPCLNCREFYALVAEKEREEFGGFLERGGDLLLMADLEDLTEEVGGETLREAQLWRAERVARLEEELEVRGVKDFYTLIMAQQKLRRGLGITTGLGGAHAKA